MLRALGMFGLGGIFLIISPELRGTVRGLIEAAGKLLDVYSPLSYVGVALALFLGAMFWVHRSAQAR
jgi:hypothetical protein